MPPNQQFFINIRPATTIKTPKMILIEVYNTITNQCRWLSSMYVSLANDEKVVNPPQNPVMSSALIVGEITFDLSANPKSTPISKDPRMFTTNVPIGNVETTIILHKRPVK